MKNEKESERMGGLTAYIRNTNNEGLRTAL